jgi:hypothetical protein
MESVVERDYSTPQVAVGEVEDIGEPSFIPPSYEDIVAQRETESIEQEPSPFENPNPAYNELDDKDKKQATESLVDTCLDAYEQLHKYAEYVIKVDEDELIQKEAEGKIDLQMQIPVTEKGDTMSVAEFVGQYNQQSASAIKYDKEFGYKVRPAMIRVFMKRGWGMSDEQYLMYMFGKDIAVKVGMMYSLKKTINNTLATLEKAHKRNKAQSRPQPQPQPQPQPMYEEEYEEEEDDVIDLTDSDSVEEVVAENENFTTKMDINMPQNPTDPMKDHPTEIQNELRNEKKKKK